METGNTNLKLGTFSQSTVVLAGVNFIGLSAVGQVLQAIAGTTKGEELRGTDGDELINGLQGRDTLIGGAGNDILIGGLDGDRLIGGTGSDRFVFNDFNERTDIVADFNANEDTLVFTNLFAQLTNNNAVAISDIGLQFVQDGLNTKVQVDPDGINGLFPFTTIAILENVTAQSLTPILIQEITGTSSADRMIATNGNHILSGLEGQDTLIGGTGDDILIGGMGSDILTGGAGSDRFVYNSLDERTDIISDFNVNEDMFVLNNLFNQLGYDGIDPISDGYLQFIQQGINTWVQVNPDTSEGFFPLRTIALLPNVNAGDLVVGSNIII